MKSGVIVVIALVILLGVVGGYFYLNSNTDNGDGVVCTADVQGCFDGSFVARNPANNCEFFSCPTPSANNQTNNSQEQVQSQTYNMDISGFAFVTKTLTINVGDTVTWTNKDSSQHTVTSDSGSELDSQYLSRNAQYSHIFTSAGTYNYHCTPHPYMKGTIIVR